MSSRYQQTFRLHGLQILDAILVWFGFWIAWEQRDWVRISLAMGSDEKELIDVIRWVLYIAVPFTPLVLEKFGFYTRLRGKSFVRSLQQITKGVAVIAIVIAVYALLAKFTDARRLGITLGFLNVAVFLLIRDRLVAHYLSSRKVDENLKERVVLAGKPEETALLLKEMATEIADSWHLVCHFDLQTQAVESLYDIIKEHSVERVIFTSKGIEFEKVAQAVESCELLGVEAWISASFTRSQIARPTFDVIGDKPMLVLRSTPELSWQVLCKEWIDRIGAAVIIAFSLPFWLFAYIGIRLKSPGAPVFFCQQRAGRYGKPFRMWKFRTMVPNAETMLQEIKESHGNQMDGPVFKLDHDPRIFPFGALLRKLSIDELPQLINVLKGEMSLVGPRPLPLYEVEAFDDMSHRRRLSVKPGITCEWQAYGRNQITRFNDWVEMDLHYIDNWSLWLDLVILIRTIPAVLFARGAK